MSKLGKRWEIDGVPAAFITRSAVNGHYCITFEREEARLEQLENIQWATPSIVRLTDHEGELGLPEGYGFEITDAFTGENLGVYDEFFLRELEARSCGVYTARLVKK